MAQDVESESESPSVRYAQIEDSYIISIPKLHEIRKEFIDDMIEGLEEDDLMPPKEKTSSLKMLCSHVRSVPDGTEKGVYYTLDWGGTNYRVLRIEFSGKKGSKPVHTESKMVIEDKYRKCDSSEQLFNYLAKQVADKLKADKADPNIQYPVGFTFSFPMAQPALNQGILVEWTKGFDIPGVVGVDVVGLMHKGFAQHKINAQIHAVCNDTVGTLLACAYDHENVRVGLILGTGFNACYIEPERPAKLAKYDKENEEEHKENVAAKGIFVGDIINIEWGGFSELLPRTKETDIAMDKYSSKPGTQYAEKMISGRYLGELVRLLAIEVFKERITKYGEQSPLNVRWKFESKSVSYCLQNRLDNNVDGIVERLRGPKGGLKDFSKTDAEVFGRICHLIVNRSADLSATLLFGALEKTGVFVSNPG
eukprot:52970_1